VPTADAGVAQVIRVNQHAVLDGRGSLDPEGGALTLLWSQTEGVPVVFDDVSATRPTFTPSAPGTYVFALVVQSSGLQSSPDTVTVQVVDDAAGLVRRPPAAEPRAGGLVHSVFLSVAPPGDLHATPPVNRVAGLDLRAVVVDLAADPTDDPPPAAVAGLRAIDVVVVGERVATLWFVPPPDDDSDPGEVLFEGGEEAPVLAYGIAGKPFVLDGSKSQDDEVVRTFTWTQVGGPFKFSTPAGELGVEPLLPDTYVFDLVVTDSTGLTSLPRRLRIPVLPGGSTGQGPPLAAARHVAGASEDLVGGEPVLRTRTGITVTMDDGASLTFAGGFPDPSPAARTYRWVQTSGPLAVLSGSDAPRAGFVPPAAGSYEFDLEVTDANGVWDQASLAFSVAAPGGTAPAAALAEVADAVLPPGGGVVVVLDGSASQGGPAPEFFWSQVRGPPYVVEPLAAAGPGVATVSIDQAGVYEFELTVFDGTSRSPPARRTFTVR
jgi:hypothetical protein